MTERAEVGAEKAQVPTDVYAVGVLSALHRIKRALDLSVGLNGKRVGLIRHALRVECRYLLSQARERNWRAVRNSFNGYLAEHQSCAHNCGKGWTKRAAQRRADQLCAHHIDEALASLDNPFPPGQPS